jgi:hypothetical protein
VTTGGFETMIAPFSLEKERERVPLPNSCSYTAASLHKKNPAPPEEHVLVMLMLI